MSYLQNDLDTFGKMLPLKISFERTKNYIENHSLGSEEFLEVNPSGIYLIITNAISISCGKNENSRYRFF